MNYKTVGILSNVLLVAGFIASLCVLFLFEVVDNLLPILIVAIVLIVAGIFVKYKFYNCPYCGKSLLEAGNKGAKVTACPHCGKKLN